MSSAELGKIVPISNQTSVKSIQLPEVVLKKKKIILKNKAIVEKKAPSK